MTRSRSERDAPVPSSAFRDFPDVARNAIVDAHMTTDAASNALYALHALLTRARLDAYEKADHAVIASVLDTAEYVLGLACQHPCDRERMRAHLAALASAHPRYGDAVARFDDGPRDDWPWPQLPRSSS